ncbi:hypothetical protein LCGC14_1366180, partial [marine sediment metagenome]
VDKSGSMRGKEEATISGINEQIESTRKAKEDFENQEQIVCLVKFGQTIEHDEFWNKEISSINDLNNDNYQPDDPSTKLLDAVGISVNKLRNEIKSELEERKANVILSIFTDGLENDSKEYNHSQIKDLIGEIKETGQWTVTFLGCSDNVFEVAESMGISRGDTLSYANTSKGTQSAFSSMAKGRYARSAMYSANLEEGIGMAKVNLNANFFENMDVSDPRPNKEIEKED